MKHITTFKDIPIHRNTLVLCDIDDTVILFEKLGKKWWRERFDDYYARNGDFEFSEKAVLKEWVHQIHKQNPVYVDESGFIDFIDRINNSNSIIMYVTARSRDLADLTLKHLNYLGIKPNNDIHYTSNTTKGNYIANALNFTNFDHVVFIDDMEHNVESVEQVFGDKVTCYLVCNT